MKKVLLSILGLTMILMSAAQVPAEGFIHLQSLSIGARYFINDSIEVSVGRKGDLTYFSKRNINTMVWEHTGVFPDEQLPSSVNSIAMQDTLNGVLLGFDNTIHYTSDGGASFQKSGSSFSGSARRVYRTSTGYIAHFQLNTSNQYIYHSEDGVNWTRTKDGGAFTTPSFVGDTIFYSTGSAIRISPDGGKTFPISDFMNSQSLPASFTYLCVVNSTLFFGGNANDNYRYNGTAWEEITTLPPATFSIVGAVFKNEQEGLLHQGVNGGYFYTTDGGDTWTKGVNIPMVQQGTSFVFSGDKLFNSFYYTTNWGQNWKAVYNSIGMGTIHDISFYNQLGILVGANGAYSITTDGGRYFNPSGGVFTSQRITACAVLNDSVIVVGDFRGEVWRSTDKGTSWTKVFYNGQNNTLIHFKWTPEGRIIGARRFTTPIISSDFGETFTTTSRTASNMFDFKPSGALINARQNVANGLEVFSMATLTTNRALLASIDQGAFESYNIKMASNNVGYVFGEEGGERLVSYRTEDGGSSWTRQDGVSESTMDFEMEGSKIYSFGEEKIVVSQSKFLAFNPDLTYNKLFLSENGGTSWTEYTMQNPGIDEYDFIIKSIHFFDVDKYMMGGENGTVYLNTLSTEGVVTSVDAVAETQNGEVFTVYPNPVSEELSIDLKNLVSSRTTVVVSVTDVSGRKVMEKHIVGNRGEILSFDTRSLESGMYFLSTEVSGQVFTQKIYVNN